MNFSALIITLISIVPAGGCLMKKTDRGTAESATSSVSISLPDKSGFSAALNLKLNGYRLHIEPIVDGCNGAKLVDRVSAWEQTQIDAVLQQGCDYSIGIEAGELSADRTALAGVYFTNWQGTKRGLLVSKDSFLGRPTLQVSLQLLLTDAGKAVGFNTNGAIGLPPPQNPDTSVNPPPPQNPDTSVNLPPSGQDNGSGPGSAVTLATFAALNNDSSAPAGTILRDIVNHIPTSQIANFKAELDSTWGHETSHGIHAYIRNSLSNGANRVNGFYVLNGQYALVKEPGIRKSAVARFVPSNLHGSRYNMYVVGATDWNDRPLYIFDEWNAYINGGATAVDLVKQNKWKGGSLDAVRGIIEFNVYALAVAMAVQDGDASYFRSDRQFREFIAYNMRRGMVVYNDGIKIAAFQGFEQEEWMQKLRTSPEAAALRNFAQSYFSAAWCKEVLGF